MKRVAAWGLVAVTLLGAPDWGDAQTPPSVWLMAHGDTVTVQLPQVPLEFHGFHVYRGPVGGPVTRMTEEPVVPLRDPVLMLSALGEDAAVLEDATRSTNAIQMTRRIQSDPITAAAYSFLFPSVAEVLGRRYRDTSVEVGARYRYDVVLLDASGSETDEVLTGEVEVRDVRPGTPEALGADVEESHITLRWSYREYAGVTDDFVTGFHVYRAPANDSLYQRLTDMPVARDDRAAPEWLDRDVRSGQTYAYVVRAVDLIGREGPASPPLTVSPVNPRPPLPPEAVVTLPGEGRVEVLWRVPPELAVAGYHIERALGLDEPYARLNDAVISLDEPSWLDENVLGGVQYFYRVVAVDGDGRESAPSNPIAAVPFDNEPPPPPVDVTATVEARRLQVRWQPPEDPEVMGYHVYRGEDASTLVRLTSEPMAGTEFLDVGFGEDGLVPGQTYLVRVSALDSLLNESAPAEVEVAVPDDVAPGAPTGLSVTNPVGRDLQLRWNAAPDLDVTHYRLARAEPGSVSFATLDSLAVGDRLEYRDGDVEPGARYRYRVWAVDGAGNQGEPAEVEAAFADGTPPPVPTFVEAALTPEGVEIRWDRVAATDTRGYRVYRATRPTGVLTPVSPVIAVGSELRFVDESGSAQDYYRVVAIDTSGNESDPTPPVQPGGTP